MKLGGKLLLFTSALLLQGLGLAEGQQPKLARIGYISGSGSKTDQGPYVEALRGGLRDLGHVEGKTFSIEFRGAEGKLDRVEEIVTELVQSKVDVLVVPIPSGIRRAKEITKTIPIVIVGGVGEDLVNSGIVESLARPGGNITGIATLGVYLNGKRLELLSEAIPRLTRVAVLRHVDARPTQTSFTEYETAARHLKIKLQPLDVRGHNPDLNAAVQRLSQERVDALVTITSGWLFLQRKRIADLAIRHRLPSMFQGSAWVEAGGLMSYSSNDIEAFRRAATYVDKILKGTKPADLPIEQPTRFEFLINLKTAKQIGLTIPPNVLARADRVIK